MELKDPINYTFTRDFFNVHPVLHVVFSLDKKGLLNFVSAVNSKDYSLKWDKDQSTKFRYEIMSYRTSVNESVNLVSCLCYPKDVVPITTRKMNQLSDIVKDSRISGTYTLPPNTQIQMGFSPAYTLAKIRKDKMMSLGKDGIKSNDNAFLFFDSGVLMSNTYSTILGNSISVDSAKMQRPYELFQVEYSDQVNLNTYADVYQSSTKTWAMHQKLYFNKFIIIRHNGFIPKIDTGVLNFGKAYTFKGLVSGYDKSFILMREVTEKGLAFKTFMFGRHEE
jgi:hypothetical protein